MSKNTGLEIRSGVQLWLEHAAPREGWFCICEDVTDVDAVANYLVALRMVREGGVPDADGAIRIGDEITEIIHRIVRPVYQADHHRM
jgi:hypothetical protein